MARRGTKPQPDELKLLKGTFQPCRSRGRTVPEIPDGGDGPVPPPWLKGEGLKLWWLKCGVYAKRGQSVAGCEGALAQYCALEADLIARWRKKADVVVALINAHRIYANEFYDTPASQQAAGTKRTPENRFTRNGQPPTEQAAG